MSEKKRPNDQAKQGRCGAKHTDGEPVVCSRWRGHAGPHRGASQGEFYGGYRMEWSEPVEAEPSVHP